ncbi:MAG: discoidin domain-containing protein [Gemmataceae bacterium]
MHRKIIVLGFLIVVGLPLVGLATPVPRYPRLDPQTPNSNKLVKLHQAGLRLSASSSWEQWPTDHLIDNKEQTSWYSRSGDSPRSGQSPWVKLTFPENVRIRRVTLMGNRDPQYPHGYQVLEGTWELLDANEKVILRRADLGDGKFFDFDWILTAPATVRSVKFLPTKSQAEYDCVALGEWKIE